MTAISKNYTLSDILDIIFYGVFEAPGARLCIDRETTAEYLINHLEEQFKVIVNDNGEVKISAV